MLQYYSALPFNIGTGGTTIQGTSARPTINGAFINRNAGERIRFLQPERAVKPQFPVGRTCSGSRLSPKRSIC